MFIVFLTVFETQVLLTSITKKCSNLTIARKALPFCSFMVYFISKKIILFYLLSNRLIFMVYLRISSCSAHYDELN